MLHAALELDDLFDAHHGLVFRTAYRITGNAADAEDVLQTVFLRLLGRDPGGSTLEKPESYLRRAAINVALDLVRAGKVRAACLLTRRLTRKRSRTRESCVWRSHRRYPA